MVNLAGLMPRQPWQDAITEIERSRRAERREHWEWREYKALFDAVHVSRLPVNSNGDPLGPTRALLLLERRALAFIAAAKARDEAPSAFQFALAEQRWHDEIADGLKRATSLYAAVRPGASPARKPVAPDGGM